MTDSARKKLITLALAGPLVLALVVGMWEFQPVVIAGFGLIPVVAIGAIVSAVTKTSPNSNLYAAWGYLAPSLLVAAYVVLISLFPEGLV